MNFDQPISLRLQQWRATLDDQDFRMQNPEGHRETLREMASALRSEGLINQIEQFELNEIADAAYWHAVEELQDSSGLYRGASTYDIVQVDTGKLLGTISRSIFNFESDEPRGASFPYDGKVYSDAEGVRLTLGLSRKIGTISGLMLEMNGRRYQLIETERVISGVDYKPLDDPDAYRALVDVAQAAKEDRNLRAFEKVRPHIESATFCMCPACLDHFCSRDDCSTCAGKGFVTKPSPSSRT
ncbi:hypothetical protein [Pseudomonas fluorescens]|uniref:hypothetical protein n=1 Tax=Pseudomonas fluorescens TaxID=294 RepID=UPI001241CFF2|nr:hypothetical protein [Pseudomonas fluorescens]VVP68136.1 hypothetical protein PS906_01556 [Pseudomonas fluorescens]